MYTEFYGLKEYPFNITPDPHFLFLSPVHQEAIQHLRYGIAEKKGFIVLTGEVGCGKTTLCRYLLEEIESKPIETALIMNPRVSETQLLQAILRELGVGQIKQSKQECLEQLNRHLLKLVDQGRDIVVIIDEAQNMTFQALENIRLLSNLETNTRKLLQIILIGQPELKEKLQHKSLRQLKQRILVHYDLRPLNQEEMEQYIRYRLILAGANGRPEFSKSAMKKVYKHSKGIPRLVNNLCDKSILSAYIKTRDKVTWWDVRRAVKEMKQL